MTDLCTHRRDIASCPWPKQSYFGKCSNGKLRTSTLANNKTLRSTADFASALSNVNNVKISDLLEFLVMLLFSSFCFQSKIICRKLHDFENIHGRDSSLITCRIFLPFSPAAMQKHTWMTFSYEVTPWNF